MKHSPETITSLKPFECFVFGSNLSGIHGAGAAKQALGWGAVRGEGIGPNGNTYAIPTKDKSIRTMPVREIAPYVHDFYLFAGDNKGWTFLVTEIGCGLAGHGPEAIAPLFGGRFLRLPNVLLPKRFIKILNP